MKQVTDFIILNKKKQKIKHKRWWSMSPQDGAQWEATAFIWECVCVFASVSMCVFACFNGYLSLSCVYVCDCVYLCVISHGMSLCVFVVFVCFCLCVYFCLCHLFCLVFLCVHVCVCLVVCLCRRKRLPTPTAELVGTPGATWTWTHTFKKQQTTKTNKPPYMPIKKTQRRRQRGGFKTKNWIILETQSEWLKKNNH